MYSSSESDYYRRTAEDLSSEVDTLNDRIISVMEELERQQLADFVLLKDDELLYSKSS